jgi:hypothetical protein
VALSSPGPDTSITIPEVAMDGFDFDRVIRAFATNASRRRAIGATALGLLAGLVSRFEVAAAKPKNKKGNGTPKKKPCPRTRRCGKRCCKSFQTCRKGRCIHHCNDGKHNHGETGTDCGGTCRDRKKCPTTGFCRIDADCQSGICHTIENVSFCVDCLVDSDCGRVPGKKICSGFFCDECASDADCTGDPTRPFCVATNICGEGPPCECSECRPGQDDCPDDAPTCIPALGICSTVS